MDTREIKDMLDPIVYWKRWVAQLCERIEEQWPQDCDANRDAKRARTALFIAEAKGAIGAGMLPAFPHDRNGPQLEINERPLCDYMHCSGGMGVAGMGSCYRGGDPRVKECPLFEDEKIALAGLEQLPHFEEPSPREDWVGFAEEICKLILPVHVKDGVVKPIISMTGLSALIAARDKSIREEAEDRAVEIGRAHV